MVANIENHPTGALPETSSQPLINRGHRMQFWAGEQYRPAVEALRGTLLELNKVIFNQSDEELALDPIHADLDRGDGLVYADTLDGEPRGFGIFRVLDLHYGGTKFGSWRFGQHHTRLLHIMDRGFLPDSRGTHNGRTALRMAIDYFDPDAGITRTHNVASPMSIKVAGPTFPVREENAHFRAAFYDEYAPAQELLGAFLDVEGLAGKVDLRTGRQEHAYAGRMGRFHIRPENYDTRSAEVDRIIREDVGVDRQSGHAFWQLFYINPVDSKQRRVAYVRHHPELVKTSSISLTTG